VRVQQEYEANMLDTIPVSAVMVKDPPIVPHIMTVNELIGKINAHDPNLTRHQALLIVDESHALRGIITRHDILKAISQDRGEESLLEAGTTELVVAYPTESVAEALTHMLEANVGRLPVVDPAAPTHIVGYLSRGNIMEANLKRLQEEREFEAGWLLRGSVVKVSGR
jgi:CBS domain-containing protein